MKKTSSALKVTEAVMRLLLTVCGLAAVGFVIVITGYLVVSGIPAIQEIGLIDFLAGTVWKPNQEQFGILPVILTSVLGTFGAILIGVPLGLLFAILRTAAFYGVGIVAAFVQARLMAYLTQGTMKQMRDELFTHMQTLPIKYFDTHAHGDIMSVYTNDIDTLRQMVSQSIPQMLNCLITIISVLASMISLSIPLTILTLVMVAVMLLCSRYFVGNSGRFFIDQQRELGRVNGYIEEMMNGQKVIKVFCHEQQAIEEFDELNDSLYHSANKANTYSLVAMPINGQLGNLSYVLCAIVGGMLALSGVVVKATKEFFSSGKTLRS